MSGRKHTALGVKRGKLRDSYGAWAMSDKEEAEIFPNLNANWKKTTVRIRGLKARS